jgi:pSer/pThr/pTyr-binding forkhead associated (FHA) protein
LTIGRDAGNNVVLGDDGVSGFHAEIQTENGRVFLVDLATTNGTFVNGKRITGRQELKPWDRVRFDRVEAEVVDPAGRRPTQVRRAVSDADIRQAGAGATRLRPAVGEWLLKGRSGLVQGKTQAVAGKLVVGRDESCDIVIPSDEVSRRHAEIEPADGALAVRDLGSANGTFVNGKRVTGTQALKAGDIVAFDCNELAVEGPAPGGRATVVRSAVGDTHVRAAVGGSGTRVMPAAGPTLAFVSGGEAGRREDIATGATVGRGPDNAIVIDDATVSGSHARLSEAGGSWAVQDLGSTNGTFVNGKRVTHGVVKAGDRLRFGSVELRFEMPETRGGTRAMPGVDGPPPTSIHSAAKKGGIPAWTYALVGFLVVGLGVGGYLFHDGTTLAATRQIEAKLQGGKVWAQQIQGRQAPSTPVIADVNGDGFLDVVLGDANGFVLALDGQGGKKIFETDVSDRILAPLAVADFSGDGISDVLVATNAGLVAAINGRGQKLWTSASDLGLGSVLNRPAVEDVNADGVPDAIVPTTAKGLVALDGKRGWKLWDTAATTKGKVVGSPLAADLNGDGLTDFVSVSDSGQVLAVSAQGKRAWVLWEAAVGPVLYASPVYADEGLVVVATEQDVVALRADNGRVAWRVAVGKPFFASPVITDANGDGRPDVIAVAQSGDIHVLDGTTGDEIWSAALGAEVQATPALFDANGDGLRDLIVLDKTGRLQIIDMNRGRPILAAALSSAGFTASPVYGDLNNDRLLEIVAAGLKDGITAFGINRTTGKGQAAWPEFLANDRHSLN